MGSERSGATRVAESGRARRHAAGLTSLLLAASLAAVLVAVPGTVRAATLYVGGVGAGNYTSIQAAVNAASPGDTVFVYSGTYREAVTIPKALTLQGQGRDTTIIDGMRTSTTVQINTGPTVLRGFTITNGASRGVSVSAPDSLVEDNRVSESYSGIYVAGMSRARLLSNIVSSNTGNGIDLSTSADSEVIGNLVSSNGAWGIYLSGSVGNRIEENDVSSNRRGIFLEQSSSNTLARNTAWSNEETSSYNYGAGIFLRSSTGNTIEENNLSSNSYNGIRLEYSARNVLRGNSASGNYYGVYLLSSSANLLEQNEVSWNSDGIVLDSSSSNTLRGNRVTSNSDSGLDLSASSNNTIEANTIASNRYEGLRLYFSSENQIFHNTIGGNARQASDSSQNAWDEGYPAGGNYWSDYDGVDAMSGPAQSVSGSDGIGDTLYYVGASVDRYPLMAARSSNPLSPPSSPLNLTATPGDAQVVLTWEAPVFDGGSPLINYWIYRGMPYSSQFLAQVGTVLTFTDSGLTNGQMYSYWVAARNTVGGGISAGDVRVTPATVPQPPAGLAATPESRLVTLTWQPTSDDGGSRVTNYLVYRGTAPSSLSLLAEVGDVRQYADIGLSNGQTYHYAVASKNAVGEGPASATVAVTPAAVITFSQAPDRVSASPSDRRVTLSWAAPADNGGSQVLNYSVYRGAFAGGEAFLAELGDVREYNDTGLRNGQLYFYRVAARTAFGEGERSDSIGAMPLAAPGAPLGLTAVAEDGAVRLTWIAPVDNGGSAVTHYTLYRGTAAGTGDYLAATSGDILAFTDTEATNGVSYHYYVTASSVVGEGVRSNEVTATPSALPSDWWIWAVLFLAAVVAVAAVLYLRRRAKKAPPPKVEGARPGPAPPPPVDPKATKPPPKPPAASDRHG